jgi:hypothetical protein
MLSLHSVSRGWVKTQARISRGLAAGGYRAVVIAWRNARRVSAAPAKARSVVESGFTNAPHLVLEVDKASQPIAVGLKQISTDP